MTKITYKPPKSVEAYIRSDKFISLICGPVGSGKTTASIFKILWHASQMKAQEDGIRRSRCVVIRNTKGQLIDTTIPSIQTWFTDEFATYHKTEQKMTVRIGDIELELLFRGMDDQQDVRKLLSLEVSFAFMDEFREIPQAIFDAVQGRVGRYPSRAKGGCVKDDGSPNHHVFGSTNPPDYSTFFADFMQDPPENADIFFQPSGLSPEADWLDNLIDGYYENLVQGKSPDWVDVYVNNKFGRSLAGMPVFRSFDRSIHVAKGDLVPVRGSSGLVIGLDVGLSPAATIGQVDYTGRLNVLECIVPDERIGMVRFINEYIKPALAQRYPGMSVVIVADPAGQQRSQTDEKTVYEVLRANGFKVVPARTNAISARIAAVETYLTRTVDGKPSILFDKEHCKELIVALSGKYRFKTNTKGETDETPEKSHPHSDVADSLQYLCLHADGGLAFGHTKTVARPVEKAKWVYS